MDHLGVSCRRRQQECRKGCSLPAVRSVFEVFRYPVASPRSPPVCPYFQPENHGSGNFRSQNSHCQDFRRDMFLPRGLPVYFVRVPQVAPWRLQPDRPRTSDSSASYSVVIRPLSSDHIDDGARSPGIDADYQSLRAFSRSSGIPWRAPEHHPCPPLFSP